MGSSFASQTAYSKCDRWALRLLRKLPIQNVIAEVFDDRL